MEPPSPSTRSVSETDIGGLGYLGRMRYGAIWKHECSRAHEVAGRIRHTFVSEQLCCIDIEEEEIKRRKNTHTTRKGIVDLGSFRIHLTAVRQTRSRSDHVKLHAVNCGEKSIRYADHVPLSSKQNR